MFSYVRPALLPALLIGLCGSAAAQTSRPAPDDPRAPVPPLQYQSPLAGYRAHAEQDIGSWRAANERVGQVGGWKAYAREAAQSTPADAAPAVTSGDHANHAKPAAQASPPAAPVAAAHSHGQSTPDKAHGMHGRHSQHHQHHHGGKP